MSAEAMLDDAIDVDDAIAIVKPCRCRLLYDQVLEVLRAHR